MADRPRLFVSYSHADEKYLNELKLVLAPLIRGDRMVFWDDSHIQPGAEWRKEIESALGAANVVVVLVSANLLASEFVMRTELPIILDRVKRNSMRLLWVAVGHALVSETELNDFQALNDPRRPLEMLDRPQRMLTWTKIAEAIKEAIGVSTVAGALGTMDESFNLVRSVVEGSTAQAPAHPVAEYTPRTDTVAFTAHGMTVTITADDMKALDRESLELIQMYEDSMRQRFDRIKRLYPSRVLPDGEIDSDVDGQIRKLARPMCDDLQRILDFLASMGKYLHDHYHRYRQLCVDLHQ